MFRKINRSENYVIIPLDLYNLLKMIVLKDINELHDKIIVSTAKYLNVSLITKDTFLQNLTHIKTVW
ncbi:MAG: hypothetical protein HGA41_03870 [Syntrophaceae bacterium]|nr:hypothetical protein [Syntrophaceae bacterium]